jgi:hypothetical protein
VSVARKLDSSFFMYSLCKIHEVNISIYSILKTTWQGWKVGVRDLN